jgi:hypothetical protein
VATIIRSCFQETSLTPIITPAVLAGEFSTKDTIFFDTMIIGKRDGAVAEIIVEIVNDNVESNFHTFFLFNL